MAVLNPQPLHPQLRRLNLQTINACPPLDSLFILIILVRIAPTQQITPSLLHHFTPSEQITPSELQPPLAGQLLQHFTPSKKLPPHSYTILPPPPPWQPNSYIILPPLYKLPPHSYTILPP